MKAEQSVALVMYLLHAVNYVHFCAHGCHGF